LKRVETVQDAERAERRDTQKTQNGIETGLSAAAWADMTDVATPRKPRTGLKRES